LKIVFMGTPDFAVTILKAILSSKHEITAVITQPDKQKGRGKEIQFSAIKEYALAQGLPVLQPLKIKEYTAVEELRKLEADIFVVAAFGQLISKEILDMPKYGCINVHASLLPKYRGAAPIQWAIINGEAESGVTIMQMDEGLDTGNMIMKYVVPIEKEETGSSLHDKLAETGAKLCVDVLDGIENGAMNAIEQNNEEATYVKMISKELGQIDFKKSAVEIERMVRGLTPWPSAYTSCKGRNLKIWKADVVHEKSEGDAGSIARVTKSSIVVNTGKELLEIKELQIEGKKKMDAGSFLLGYELHAGEQLGI